MDLHKQAIMKARDTLSRHTRDGLLLKRSLLERVAQSCEAEGDERWKQAPAKEKLSVQEQLQLINEALMKFGNDQSVVIPCKPAVFAAITK